MRPRNMSNSNPPYDVPSNIEYPAQVCLRARVCTNITSGRHCIIRSFGRFYNGSNVSVAAVDLLRGSRLLPFELLCVGTVTPELPYS